MTRRLWLCQVLLVGFFMDYADPSPSMAQGNSVTVSVFPPAPRSLRQNLVRAKKAIDEGRFSDAVLEIGVVLTGRSPDATIVDESQDFFLEAPGQPAGTQTSIKAEAQRMLGTMPPKGRELFELQFGADARALFDEAVQSSDVNRLNEVVRQYFHTKAGYEAALLLGRLHLDHGRPLAAALCLQRVAQVPGAASQFEPELSLLLAACWQLARQPAQAQATLATLPPRLPRGQIRLGDAEVNELPTAQQAVAWLTEHFRSIAVDETEAGEWPLFRGSPSRNAVRSGGIPLNRSRWQVPLVIDETERGLIEELRNGFIEQGSPMLPVVQPLAVGNVIVLRSSERLVGIDFESGKRVWEYPFWNLPQDDESQQPTSTPPQNDRDRRLNVLRERLWQDVPFGQVSSDGNSVYLLDELEQSPMQEWNPRMRLNRARGFFQMETGTMRNELVALDLHREGYQLWTVGGKDGHDEPKLAEVFFLGPPLPLFGNLYLIAEVKGELRLIVLDAATGKQQWSQQLAHMEAMFGMDPQLRRYSGATPSFADGVLVCPTSAGAVVAVDIATRTLLWGYQYSPNNRDAFGRQGLMQQPFSIQPPFSVNRWQDAAVTIADGNVVITPVESEALICLDLLTGKPRWTPLPRNGELADMLYVAGVYDGSAVVVGKNRVTAIRLKDGKPAWKDSIKLSQIDNEMPSGRGFLTDHFYFLPTTKSQLLRIDLREGQVVQRTVTDHALGNVICFRDEIISVTADRAAAFFQIEPLRKKVDSRLKEAPDDAWALARLGELLVHDGKTVEALDVLRKAHQRDNADEGVRSLLVDTYLTAIREDFSKHSGLAPEIEPLIDTESQRAKYLMLVATGYQKIGNSLAAAEYFGKFIHLAMANAKKIPTAEGFALVTPEKDWTVRTDRFLSSRLEELVGTADSSVRDRIDGFVREVARQTDATSTADVRRFLQLCGFHPASDDLRLQLANKLIDGGEFLEAELLLTPLLGRTNPQSTGSAVALAAKLYGVAKKPKLADVAYQQLLRDWSDVAVLNGKTGRQLFDEATAANPSQPMTKLEWPWGMVTHSEAHDGTRNSMYTNPEISFSIMQRRGIALENLKLVFDNGPTSTYLRDGNGTVVFRLPNSDGRDGRPRTEPGLWQTAADGHLLFSYFNGHLLATNTLHSRPNESEAQLWRETIRADENESLRVLTKEIPNPFDSNPLQVSRFGDQLGRPVATIGPMTSQGVCFQKIRAVVCVDPRTGTPVWIRNDFEQGCELFGDHEFVFVQPPTSSPVQLQPRVEGLLKKELESADVECVMLSASDGRTLGKRRVPAPTNRWTIQGRRILAWEQRKDSPEKQLRLYLYDAERQVDLWSETFPEGSRGCLIENDSVAVLQPDGRFVVRSLTGSTESIETRIEPAPSITSIRVLASRDQLWLLVNDAEPGEGEAWRRKALIPADGRIFCLDRANGRSLWQVPALVRGFGMLPDQPAELPTLWFVRYQPGTNTQFGATSNARVDVLCLDRRTGASLFAKGDIPSNLNQSEISADLRKKEITLALPQAQFTLRFTAEPRPPAPPFRALRTGNKLDVAFERLGDLMESVKGALTPAAKSDDPFK
jgi:outer membrane protein assembly factor BamB